VRGVGCESLLFGDVSFEPREPGDEVFAGGELAALFLIDKDTARARWPAARKRAYATTI
jgi:hypothetical protein